MAEPQNLEREAASKLEVLAMTEETDHGEYVRLVAPLEKGIA